jgi:hypothetical protein
VILNRRHNKEGPDAVSLRVDLAISPDKMDFTIIRGPPLTKTLINSFTRREEVTRRARDVEAVRD